MLLEVEIFLMIVLVSQKLVMTKRVFHGAVLVRWHSSF